MGDPCKCTAFTFLSNFVLSTKSLFLWVLLLYTVEFGFWGMTMLGKACKGAGPTQTMGCWSTLWTRERKHVQGTPGCSAFVTPSVDGLAHLHGKAQLCAVPSSGAGGWVCQLTAVSRGWALLPLKCTVLVREERSWHLPAALCSVMCGVVQMYP